MSAHSHAAPPPLRIALLGTGLVGRALLGRLDGTRTELGYLASTRRAYFGSATREGAVSPATLFAETVRVLADATHPVVVDATASDDVAAMHEAWLGRGIHVVTANKAGVGASLGRWRGIEVARARSSATYGDSATVGAGLPVLRAIRRLRAAGERVHELSGCLSGSLAFIFDRPDDEPLATRVRAAQAAGLTEPDPADDLAGADVARKLLVLARAAGHATETGDVRVAPIIAAEFEARLRTARARGAVLRHVARIDAAGRCSAGLEMLAPDDPLVGARGSELRIAIRSDRYAQSPLVLQGTGAGAVATAGALLDDLGAITR